jgi:peptidoglycan LD-endopeptidase CwlK
MIDQLTLTRIDTLHPKIKEEVKNIYLNEVVPALKTVTCRFAYTLRTIKEQNDLYALGRTKLFDANGKRLGIVTNAKGGQSYHNYGLAFDIVLLTKSGASWDIITDFDGDGISDWKEIVNIFKKHGYVWGGDWKFKDAPHFEKSFGHSVANLQTLHSGNKFIPGTQYVQI